MALNVFIKRIETVITEPLSESSQKCETFSLNKGVPNQEMGLEITQNT